MARNKTVEKMMAAVRAQDEVISGASGEELTAAAGAMDDINADAGTALETPAVEPETPPVAPPEPEPAPAPTPEVAKAPEPVVEEVPPAGPAEPPAAGDKAMEAQRREIARLRAQLAAERQSKAATAPPMTPAPAAAAPAPKQEEDPEPERPGARPNREEYPVQYDEWQAKVIEHQAWEMRQLRQNVTDLTSTVQRGAQMTTEQQNAVAFDQAVGVQRRSYAAKNPHFDAAVEHLQNIDREDMRDRGLSEYEIENNIRGAERNVLGTLMLQAREQINQGLLPPETNIAEHAFEQIMRRAQRCGFNPGPVAVPNPAPTPQRTVASTAARAAAARTASTMRPTPAPLPSDEKMTAERFMNELTPMQRQQWKKANPDWEIKLGLLSNTDNFVIASR